jgi:hypothetical protein
MQTVSFEPSSATRASTTSATSFGQWMTPGTRASATFRATDEPITAPAPMPVISELERAFETARTARREAVWERLVADADRRGALSTADWQWIWRQLAQPEHLGFHAAESIARIVVANREPLSIVAAFLVLLRLTAHPADSVKGAALTAAADLWVPLAKWLAARVPDAQGPLKEIVIAIQAMVP